MYQTLTFIHSLTRWLVLAALIYSIYRAYLGYIKNRVFSKTDNAIRHWTATIAHIQLIIGILFYVKSPVIAYFWSNASQAIHNADALFFSVLHSTLMLTAIVIVTVGSALAKRRSNDRQKFKTQLTWFLVAFIIIFIAIPWPFSPFTARPYLR